MTSTAIKLRDLDQTRGALYKRRGRLIKNQQVLPGVFNRGPAFNREKKVMYKGLYGVNLFASLGVLGTRSTVWHCSSICRQHV